MENEKEVYGFSNPNSQITPRSPSGRQRSLNDFLRTFSVDDINSEISKVGEDKIFYEKKINLLNEELASLEELKTKKMKRLQTYGGMRKTKKMKSRKMKNKTKKTKKIKS
jgi:hypothetical protein